MNRWSSAWSSRWNRFLFESCDPKIVPILRIGFAILLIINAVVWMLDGEAWFSDEGILDQESAQKCFVSRDGRSSGGTPPLLRYKSPDPSHHLQFTLASWNRSRWQVACIFLLLVSFHHRNPLICDGEDTVMRLFAFFMLFLPWTIAGASCAASSDR